MESAEILLDKKKTQQSLFFCHLALEKMLKALFTHNTGQVPPKTHNWKVGIPIRGSHR